MEPGTKERLKLLLAISRPEFLPANLASLIIGIAWAASAPPNFTFGSLVLALLSFGVIADVSFIAAQANSLGDYELDLHDPFRKHLAWAVGSLGRKIVAQVMVLEVALGVILLALFLWVEWNPLLIVLWLAGFALAYAYSLPPLRFKAKSWLAVASLLLALCFLPISFIYLTFASQVELLFGVFLVGQAMTVYAVIVPAEIRDYKSDKAMNVNTFTVRLGIYKASILELVLLILGAVTSGTAFLVEFVLRQQYWSVPFLAVMAIADAVVLRHYIDLYRLCKSHSTAIGDKGNLSEEIVKLAAQNPKWINTIQQAILLMSIILLASKFIR